LSYPRLKPWGFSPNIYNEGSYRVHRLLRSPKIVTKGLDRQ
jgi:hypothetical protein